MEIYKPEYTPLSIHKTFQKLGLSKYMYVKNIDDGLEREIRSIKTLCDGSIYQGEWLVEENVIDGRGVLITR